MEPVTSLFPTFLPFGCLGHEPALVSDPSIKALECWWEHSVVCLWGSGVKGGRRAAAQAEAAHGERRLGSTALLCLQSGVPQPDGEVTPELA